MPSPAPDAARVGDSGEWRDDWVVLFDPDHADAGSTEDRAASPLVIEGVAGTGASTTQYGRITTFFAGLLTNAPELDPAQTLSPAAIVAGLGIDQSLAGQVRDELLQLCEDQIGVAGELVLQPPSDVLHAVTLRHELPRPHPRRVQLEDAIRAQVHHDAALTEPVGHHVRALSQHSVRHVVSVRHRAPVLTVRRCPVQVNGAASGHVAHPRCLCRR